MAGHVTEAIGDVGAAAEHLGKCMANTMRLEDARAAVKEQAILNLIGTENKLTGKEHSASSAEKIVELDMLYQNHREKQYAAVIAERSAWGEYEAAKLQAQYALLQLGTGN